MNRYNLFRMAAEVMPELIMPTTPEQLEQFANIIAAAEREACAKVCDVQIASEALTELEKYRAGFIADAIRARGEESSNG